MPFWIYFKIGNENWWNEKEKDFQDHLRTDGFWHRTNSAGVEMCVEMGIIRFCNTQIWIGTVFNDIVEVLVEMVRIQMHKKVGDCCFFVQMVKLINFESMHEESWATRTA